MQRYRRYIGPCVICNEDQTIRNIMDYECNIYLLWNNTLASRVFPDSIKPQVFVAINPININIKNNEPGICCSECFDKNNWVSERGTIICHLCNTHYPRAIYSWANGPSTDAILCQCHTYNKYQEFQPGDIINGYIDPISYKWTTDNRPLNYDREKHFCDECLYKLINNGDLICEHEESENSE